jgi:hypothetical protein
MIHSGLGLVFDSSSSGVAPSLTKRWFIFFFFLESVLFLVLHTGSKLGIKYQLIGEGKASALVWQRCSRPGGPE